MNALALTPWRARQLVDLALALGCCLRPSDLCRLRDLGYTPLEILAFDLMCLRLVGDEAPL